MFILQNVTSFNICIYVKSNTEETSVCVSLGSNVLELENQQWNDLSEPQTATAHW